MLRVTKKAGRALLVMAPIPLDDAETFHHLSSGSPAIGLLYGSDYLANYLKRLKPNKLEHLIAIHALFRPFSMGQIDEFVARKNNRKRWSLAHPSLKPIIGQTFGLWLYQQQVVRTVVDLSGLTVDEADTLWKKTNNAIEKAPTLRDRFVHGARLHGIPNRTAKRIFGDLLRFGPRTIDRAHLRHIAHRMYADAYMQARYMKRPPPDPRREVLDWN